MARNEVLRRKSRKFKNTRVFRKIITNNRRKALKFLKSNVFSGNFAKTIAFFDIVCYNVIVFSETAEVAALCRGGRELFPFGIRRFRQYFFC